MSSLVLENVSKTFASSSGEVRALHSISLRFEDGEFVSIIGSNGAGKSTLLNVIAGAVLPDVGRVLLGSKDVTVVPDWQRARRIGRVFQDPGAGSAAHLTVAENLALAELEGRFSPLRHCVGRGAKDRYAEILSSLQIGMEDRLDDDVSTLSGGQRQALSVVMATVGSAELFLLDEHVAALDPSASRKVLKITERIIEERGVTTLMVTHNVEHAIVYGTRLIMLHRGRIAFDVRGDEKENLTVDKVVELYHKSPEAGSETPKFFLNA